MVSDPQEEEEHSVSNPHDKFFREALSRQEVASSFLRHYLPAEVVQLLDVSAPEISKDSFVDPELRTHFSDLLYRVPFRGGGDAFVYVLFEHKSYPDRLIAFQLLRYMVRIWEHSLRQNQGIMPIMPVVVYHGTARWRVGPDFNSLVAAPPAMKAFLPDYRYWLCDLSQYEDDDIKAEVMLGVVLLALKYILRPDLGDHLVDILGLMHELAQRETGLEYLETTLRYLSQATNTVTEEQLWKALETVFPEGESLMGTIAEKWVEQGLQRGRQEGLQQGLQEGLQEGLQQGLQEGLQEGLQQGLQEGLQQGLLDGIELALEIRFGSEGLKLMPQIYRIQDLGRLRTIRNALRTAERLDDIRELVRS